MSDFDQTIYSGRGAPGGPQPTKPKRNPLLLIGGIGCALLLCIALVAGIGLYFARDQFDEVLASLGGGTATPVVVDTPTEVIATPLPTPTPTLAVTVETAPTAEEETESGGNGGDEETATPVSEPEFGAITFALGATEDYQPINPALTFQEGITEVHAIFEYGGMSKAYQWERVWYLDGKEVLRNAQTWSGDEAGVFDYFIDAGNDPLFPGEWVLELYVEDNLLQTGSFTIEGAELAQGDNGEHAADLSPTPTATTRPTPAPSPTPGAASSGGSGGGSSSGGGTYKLVYTKWDGGQHNLYVADTNGSGEQFILNRAAGPSWTPDGKYVYFFGEAGVNLQNRDNRPGVGSCEMPSISDGIVAITLPSPPQDVCIAFPEVFQDVGWKEGTARWASVSPNGQMLAYDAKPGGDYRIYFLGTTDNQQFRFEIIGEQADWSPDSQKIVYRSGRDGKTGIWISNRDDSGHTNITQNGSDSFPAWSPDGQTIAFSRNEADNVDIYLMNVDGTNLRRITEAPGPDTLPTYTPSGDIIFRSARAGNWGIWKMSGSGANQAEIIPNAGVGPDWSFSKMDVR